MAEENSDNTQEDKNSKSLSDYRPLISLILIAAAAGWAVASNGSVGIMEWLHDFMGFFLCSFAMLKLFHPGSFADGFEKYDLLATRFRPYGYVYPFVALGLGLAYLGLYRQPATYIATIAVMLFGAIGVVSALRRGLDINCPCMGSVLDVPLSTVTLTEDIGMAVMATAMLAMTLV